MTVRLYQRDPYLFEFEARVEETDDAWIRLDGSAFYPGGGGQAADRGTIHGREVEEVLEIQGSIWHRVPGHPFSIGDMVWCSVDWDNRYDLMKGHTAEHMLFGALQRMMPELELLKIEITPEQKRLTVRGPIDRDLVESAEELVNQAISDNLEVTRYEMDREEAESGEVRAKLERIQGDTVDVVEIGDFDCAACAGIHVMETGEVGAILVDRISSAGGGDHNLDFIIGDEAIARSMDLAHLALRAADALACPMENLLRTMENLKADAEGLRKALSRLSKISLENIAPIDVEGMQVHAAALPGIPRKELISRAETLRERGHLAVLASVDDRVEFVMSCPSESGIDLRRLIDSVVKDMGGSGGGRPDFVQGGIADHSRAEEFLRRILDSLGEGV